MWSLLLLLGLLLLNRLGRGLTLGLLRFFLCRGFLLQRLSLAELVWFHRCARELRVRG
jgi:hypothetical protein